MSNALQQSTPTAEIIRQVALDGNLAPLSDDQRWQYYQEYCRYLGLDPITKPFDILEQEIGKDNSKKKIVSLYPNAKCAAQLTRLHTLTFSEPKVEMIPEMNLCVVRVEVRTPQGASRWGDSAFVYDKNKAWSLPNDYKKAITQAHRRAVLGICGVSGPDESEVEDIPNPRGVAFVMPGEMKALKAVDTQAEAEAPMMRDEQSQKIIATCKAMGKDAAVDAQHFLKKEFAELTETEADTLILALEAYQKTLKANEAKPTEDAQ